MMTHGIDVGSVKRFGKPRHLDAARCWNDLRQRKEHPQPFFYGVRTTGIYCRSLCRTRLPRQENVSFYPSASEAQAAGFRPCKRCRPDEASMQERQRHAILKACTLIKNTDPAPGLAELARVAGMSRYHFHRVFKQVMGVTPKDYIRARQNEVFAAQLANGKAITRAVYDSGFGASSRAYEAARRSGMTPSVRKKQGQGEIIFYATGKSQLGAVILAATSRGICFTGFNDSSAPLIRELKQRFPTCRTP